MHNIRFNDLFVYLIDTVYSGGEDGYVNTFDSLLYFEFEMNY